MQQLTIFAHEIEHAAAEFLEIPPSLGELGADGTAVGKLLSTPHHCLTVRAAINKQISVAQMLRMLNERKRQLATYRPRFHYPGMASTAEGFGGKGRAGGGKQRR